MLYLLLFGPSTLFEENALWFCMATLLLNAFEANPNICIYFQQIVILGAKVIAGTKIASLISLQRGYSSPAPFL